MTILAGIDIGGTKCAVCIGEVEERQLDCPAPRILAKQRFPTPGYAFPGDG